MTPTRGSLPSYAIIIATHDRPAQLAECLTAIRKQAPEAELVVVDSAPTDERGRAVTAQYGAIYAREAQAGVARARNTGVRLTNADVVILTDDDAIPQPGWVENLLREFLNPEVAIVCGRVLPVSVASEAEQLFRARGGFDCGPSRVVLSRDQADWFERANFIHLGGAASMAMRRALFDDEHGLDERLGSGGELQGFGEQLAIHQAVSDGWKHVYTPEAVVLHPFPRSLEDLQRRDVRIVFCAAGYAALLYREYPEHRRELKRLIQKRLRAGDANGQPGAPPCSKARIALARLLGVARYVRIAMSGRRALRLRTDRAPAVSSRALAGER